MTIFLFYESREAYHPTANNTINCGIFIRYPYLYANRHLLLKLKLPLKFIIREQTVTKDLMIRFGRGYGQRRNKCRISIVRVDDDDC